MTPSDIEKHIQKEPALRAYFSYKNLMISNLQGDVERLNERIRQLESLSGSQSDHLLKENSEENSADSALSQAQKDLAMTITWVKKLVDRIDWLIVDEERELILDGTFIRKKPIHQNSVLVKSAEQDILVGNTGLFLQYVSDIVAVVF